MRTMWLNLWSKPAITEIDPADGMFPGNKFFSSQEAAVKQAAYHLRIDPEDRYFGSICVQVPEVSGG